MAKLREMRLAAEAKAKAVSEPKKPKRKLAAKGR